MTERAISDLIGYVLVFSLVALAVGFVSVVGVSTLNDAKAAEQGSNAERAFDVMADNLEDVYQTGAPNRATEISLADAALHTTATATMNVSGWNSSSSFTTGNVTSDIIVWEATDGPPTQIVYAFGTVLRSQRVGGVVTRSGPFRFDTDRTIIPIVQTHTRTGTSYTGGIIRVRSTRSPPQIEHTVGVEGYDQLWLNVTTDHPQAWMGYLGQSATGCSIRNGGGGKARVTCDLTENITIKRLYVTVYPMDIELER